MLDRLEALEAKVQFLLGLPSIAKDMADKRQADLEAKEAADKEAAERVDTERREEVRKNREAAIAAAKAEGRPIPEFQDDEPIDEPKNGAKRPFRPIAPAYVPPLRDIA